MSLTNRYETLILNRLVGDTTSTWTKPSSGGGTLKLHLFTTNPGETGDVSGLVTTNQGGLTLAYSRFIPTNSQSRTYTPDGSEYFNFTGVSGGETANEVVAIGLCYSGALDSTKVIWTESLEGSAVRKYKDVDQLRLSKIVFGLNGTALGADLCSAVLDHIFVESSGNSFVPVTSSYLVFYDGDPGINGTDANPIGARVRMLPVTDANSSWTVSGGVVSNTNSLTASFNETADITHIALRSAPSNGQSGDKIYWRGPLLSPQRVEVDDILAIRAGQLALAID